MPRSPSSPTARGPAAARPRTPPSTLRSPAAARGVSLGSALSDSTIAEALRRTQGDKARVRRLTCHSTVRSFVRTRLERRSAAQTDVSCCQRRSGIHEQAVELLTEWERRAVSFSVSRCPPWEPSQHRTHAGQCGRQPTAPYIHHGCDQRAAWQSIRRRGRHHLARSPDHRGRQRHAAPPSGLRVRRSAGRRAHMPRRRCKSHQTRDRLVLSSTHHALLCRDAKRKRSMPSSRRLAAGWPSSPPVCDSPSSAP